MNGFVIVGLLAVIVVGAFLWLRRRDRRRALRPQDAVLPAIAADQFWHHTHHGDGPGGDPGAGAAGGGGDAGGA